MFALSFDGLLSREFHVYERVLSCKYVALPSFIAYCVVSYFKVLSTIY